MTNMTEWQARIAVREEEKRAAIKRSTDEYEARPEIIEYRRERREEVRPMTLIDAGTHPDEIGHAKLVMMHGTNSSTLQLNLKEWAALRDIISEYLEGKK